MEPGTSASTATAASAPSSTIASKSMSVFVWNSGDMAADSTGIPGHIKVAFGFMGISFLFIVIAFSTSSWLVTDGELEKPKFVRIGLWEGCFNNLFDANHNYDIRTSGCRYLLAEELYHLNDLIFQPFFVAVQFFFTMCFVTLLIAIVLVPAYILCFGPEHDYFVLLLRIIGIVLLISAFLGTIAVIVFGAKGDSRDWMPDWQNNYLSWSFAFAVIGVFAEYVSGVLFLVESRIQSKRKKMRESQSAYTMETKA